MPLSYADVSFGGYIVRIIQRATQCLRLEIVTSPLPVPAKRPNGTPPTSDLYEDLVQVPLPLRTLLHALRSTFADLVREVGAEAIDPVTDRFVANVDAAFMEQVFNIPQ